MPSKKKVTSGPTVKERAKRLLGTLLAYVNWELEDVGRTSLSHRWQDETTKQPKLVIETQLRTLEFLTAKDKHEGKLTTTEIRQALNKHLKDFLHILEDNRSQTQGKKEWHFTLKLWSKDTQKNLEQFEIEWERLRPEKSKQQEETLRQTVAGKTPKPEDELINWQEICRQNLAQQKQLTTNPFTNAYGVTPQLEEIYVPLAIVERKPSKPPSRDRPEEKEEEKLIPIAEERFLEDVLRQGQSEISQGRKVAIIGEPGSGKTTRLQKIADWILEQDLGLPIWVSLADLTQPTITQYIEDIWLKQTGQSLTIDALTQQKHLIWLLLDGLDEMTSKVEMCHVSALLGGWVQAARVVVTCRVNVWEADKNAFSGFDVFRNLEFNPEQVTDYIRRWFAEMRDAATAESLEAELVKSENSRLKELIQNPLRLWMLCQIWQTGGGLPKTQAALYAQFVDWVYRWKADEEILDQREAIDKALAQLALVAMEQKDEVSRLRLRESWVLKVLGSRPIFQAVMKLGWLNRVERFPEAICVFYHATFQEYFAALAVDDWDYFFCHIEPKYWRGFKPRSYRIFEEKWKTVILLWFGREEIKPEKKNAFIKTLAEFKDQCGDFFSYRAQTLACLALNEFPNCLYLDFLISHLIKHSLSMYFDIEKFCFCIVFPSYYWHESKSIFQQISHSLVDEIVMSNLINYIDEMTVLYELKTTTYQGSEDFNKLNDYKSNIEKFSKLTFLIELLNLKFLFHLLNLSDRIISSLTNDQLSTLEITFLCINHSSEHLISNALELLCAIKSKKLKIDSYLKELRKKTDLFKSDKVQLTIAKYFKESSILIKIYHNTTSDLIRLDVVESLWDIKYSDVNLITEMLINVIHNCHQYDDDLWLRAILQLTLINPNHPELLEINSQLKDQLKTGLNFYTLLGSSLTAAWLKNNKDFKFNIKGGFRNAFDSLNNEWVQNDATNFGDLLAKLNSRSNALWRVAQVMSYQEFYKKWHDDQFSETTEINSITHP